MSENYGFEKGSNIEIFDSTMETKEASVTGTYTCYFQRVAVTTPEGYSRIFGCDYIGIGMAPGGMEGYDDFVRTFKPIAQKIAEGGLYLAYHNHNIEFARTGNGKEIYLERLLSDFTPRELAVTFDTYWAQAGGADAAYWLRKLRGRVRNIHLKDMAFALGNGLSGMRMAAVGEGNMNFEAILAAAEDAGTQYALIEQDECYGEDPFACLKTSYENLRAMGLE